MNVVIFVAAEFFQKRKPAKAKQQDHVTTGWSLIAQKSKMRGLGL